MTTGASVLGPLLVVVVRFVVVVVVVRGVVVGAAVGLIVALMSGTFPSLQNVTTQFGADVMCADVTTIAI